MSPVSLLVVSVDQLRLGFPLRTVERVVPACEITPLPEVPAMVIGALNLAGRAIAVLDMRPRLRLRSRAIGVNDHFLVVTCAERSVAVLVDDAAGVHEYPRDAIVTSEDLGADMAHIAGLVRLEDGLLLIEDPDRFLDVHESRLLDHALEAGGHGG